VEAPTSTGEKTMKRDVFAAAVFLISAVIVALLGA